MKNFFLITFLLASVSEAAAQLPIKMKRVDGTLYAISDDLTSYALSDDDLEICKFYAAATVQNGISTLNLGVEIKGQLCWIQGQEMRINFDDGATWVFENKSTTCKGQFLSLAFIHYQDHPEQVDHKFITHIAVNKIETIEVGGWRIAVIDRHAEEMLKTYQELMALIHAD